MALQRATPCNKDLDQCLAKECHENSLLVELLQFSSFTGGWCWRKWHSNGILFDWAMFERSFLPIILFTRCLFEVTEKYFEMASLKRDDKRKSLKMPGVELSTIGWLKPLSVDLHRNSTGFDEGLVMWESEWEKWEKGLSCFLKNSLWQLRNSWDLIRRCVRVGVSVCVCRVCRMCVGVSCVWVCRVCGCVMCVGVSCVVCVCVVCGCVVCVGVSCNLRSLTINWSNTWSAISNPLSYFAIEIHLCCYQRGWHCNVSRQFKEHKVMGRFGE